jgi:hypothetical protein
VTDHEKAAESDEAKRNAAIAMVVLHPTDDERALIGREAQAEYGEYRGRFTLAAILKLAEVRRAAPSFAADPVTPPDSTTAGSEKRNGCPTPSGAALAANPAPSLALEAKLAEARIQSTQAISEADVLRHKLAKVTRARDEARLNEPEMRNRERAD